MKKLILPIIFVLSFTSAYSQIPSDTTDLRAKINSWVVTNGTKQITAIQINQLFNGVANLMKAYSIDSAYRIADTLFLVRRGGFTTIKVTLNTGGAPSETDPTVPTVAKALTEADTSRWNNKQDALTTGIGITLLANVISATNTANIWNASQLQGNNISGVNPTTGHVLKWNGSAWAPGNDSGIASLKNKGTGNRLVGYDDSVKTLYHDNTLTIDSLQNPGGLTLEVDTTIIATLFALTQMDLQQVTDRGSKTTDTVAVGGVRTKNILTDTTDKPTFRIIFKPDTQNEVRYSWPYQLDSVAKWIEDSASYYNTKAFLGLGDITDLGNVTEMSRMDSFYMRIAAAGLVYMPILGNHDYDNFSFASVSNRLTTIYNTYFGPSRFTSDSWYGGNLDGKNDNFYTKFDAEGHKYLVVGLEYNPRDSALEWAQRVCDTFPDRETIIITHAYITAYNEKSTDTSLNTMSYGDIGNNGQEIWDKFIKKNKQIFLVAAGHYVHGGANLPAFGRIIQPGKNGNGVIQILSNYQSDTLDGYASGMGFLMTLDFDLRNGKINFNVYSPFLKKNHPAFTPFSVDYPAINIEASPGISSVNGNFNVAAPTTLDSTVHVTQLTKNRLMVVGKNGLLDTLENVAANSFLASTGVTTRPRYRTLLSTDIPAGSGHYINNQITAGQTSNFWAYNPNFPDYTGVGVVSKTPTYMTTVTSGVPMTFIVAHGNNNYGLGIQRASNNTSPAHLSFFKNAGTDFTTLVANPVGDQVGQIDWHMVNFSLGKALPVTQHAYVEKNDATALAAGLVFNTKDSANVTRSTYLNSRGNLLLGGSSVSNSYRLKVIGPVAFDLGSDASYDMYYRDAVGAFTRLPAGTDGYVLTTHSTTSAPTWESLSGGSYTFSNGLTEASGAVKLGGALTENTTISSSTDSYKINITGVNTGQPGMLNSTTSGNGGVAITGTSTGINSYGVHGVATGTGGRAIMASALDGTGVFSSATGVAFHGESVANKGLEILTAYSSTNSIGRVNSYSILTTGTAANGIGGANDFLAEMSNGSSDTTASITWEWTNATAASQTGALKFWTKSNGGTLSNKFTVHGNGQIQNNAYGSGTFTGTATTQPYFTSTGEIIEKPVPISFAQTATPTPVSGTTTETTILGSGVGETTLAAEDFPVGKTYRVIVKGVLSTDAAGSASVNFRLELGSVTIAATGNIFNSAGVTNRAYELHATFTVRSTGASGTIMCMGMYQDENDGATKFDNGTSTSTIDMTTSQAIDVTAQWNNANAGNSVSSYILTIEPVN